MVELSNKKRIDETMIFTTKRAICPNCKFTVYPKFIDYKVYPSPYRQSNLYWCNHCYKGEAKCFWSILD